MKNCRSCKKEIDNKAKKCPYCQDKQGNWAQRHPIITGILGIFVFLIVIGAANSGDSTPSTPKTSTPTETSAEDVKNDAETQQVLTTANSEEISPVNEPIETSNETVSQKNALRKAKSYLDFSGFSRSGLMRQLEFEKFSTEDATYAVDNVGADWNEQAAKKANSYQDLQGFSRDGMITQLKYEGFTAEQAAYGADAVGL